MFFVIGALDLPHTTAMFYFAIAVLFTIAAFYKGA